VFKNAKGLVIYSIIITTLFCATLVGGIIILRSGGSAAAKDTIRDIQKQSDQLAEELADSQETLSGIRTSVANVTERVGRIAGGIGDAESAIDASIRLTEELLAFIDDLEQSISENGNGVLDETNNRDGD
jgi:methyl-accepting chemotaxis protein